MTSANVTHFTVSDNSSRRVVGTFRQHCLCKDNTKAEFEKYKPAAAFHIEVNHPDENEADDIIFEGNLDDYLNRNNPNHIPRCPVCGLRVCRDVRSVDFATGSSPIHTLTVKLRAEWCDNPNCQYEKVEICECFMPFLQL